MSSVVGSSFVPLAESPVKYRVQRLFLGTPSSRPTRSVRPPDAVPSGASPPPVSEREPGPEERRAHPLVVALPPLPPSQLPLPRVVAPAVGGTLLRGREPRHRDHVRQVLRRHRAPRGVRQADVGAELVQVSYPSLGPVLRTAWRAVVVEPVVVRQRAERRVAGALSQYPLLHLRLRPAECVVAPVVRGQLRCVWEHGHLDALRQVAREHPRATRAQDVDVGAEPVEVPRRLLRDLPRAAAWTVLDQLPAQHRVPGLPQRDVGLVVAQLLPLGVLAARVREHVRVVDAPVSAVVSAVARGGPGRCAFPQPPTVGVGWGPRGLLVRLKAILDPGLTGGPAGLWKEGPRDQTPPPSGLRSRGRTRRARGGRVR